MLFNINQSTLMHYVTPTRLNIRGR